MKLANKKLQEAIENIGMTNMESAVKGAAEQKIEAHAEMPITMADNYAESERAKKHFQKVIEDGEKDAKEVIPDEPETPAVKVKNEYTKLTLDESLFEAADDEIQLSPDFVDQKPGFEDWPEDPDEAEAETKKFIGKWISELDEGEYDLFNTVYQDLVHNPSAVGGNIPGPKGYRATGDQELQDISAQVGTFEDGIKVLGKDAKQLEKAKKIAMRYYDYGVFYETKDFHDKQGYYTKELYIFIPSMDDYERDPESLRSSIDSKREAVEKKPVNEAKVIRDIDIETYESTEQGQETLDAIKDAGKTAQFESLLEDMYPNGINETTLDDLLSYESDWLFDMLDMND